MIKASILLFLQAMAMYLLVLSAHALRRRYGQAYFYALLGGTTAIMSWVTDAGARVSVAGITFMVGSTVFYTALLLGVFVVYVFDGPRNAQIAISTVMGISIMMPLVAGLLHYQADLIGVGNLARVPTPSLRINSASVFTTLVDLIFLGIAWEFLGKPQLKINLWLRSYLTLLGVMVLDVVLFNSLAFAGSPEYMSILHGTLSSRLVISVFSFPVLYGYLTWQQNNEGITIINRPVLSILQRMFRAEEELDLAQREIERRKRAEKERDRVIQELKESQKQYKELAAKYRKASTTDELTGVPNRRAFNRALQREWGRAARTNQPLSVLIMDVDEFKAINDREGHLAGDRLLTQVARVLAEVALRPGDQFARFGGDEFALILPDTDREGAMTVANNCRSSLAEMELPNGFDIDAKNVTVSIGVSTMYPETNLNANQLVKISDRALFEAKDSGRNRIHFIPG